MHGFGLHFAKPSMIFWFSSKIELDKRDLFRAKTIPVSLTSLSSRKIAVNFIVIWFLKFILFSGIFFFVSFSSYK